jgi:hypothetical protein
MPMTPLRSLCPRSTHESHETTLQTNPASQAVGPWVPAPWVESTTLIGTRGWVLNIYGDPTHRWVPNGSWP